MLKLIAFFTGLYHLGEGNPGTGFLLIALAIFQTICLSFQTKGKQMATSYKYFYIGWAPANGDFSSMSTCTIAASSSKEACNIFRKKNPTMRIIGCIPTNIKPIKEKAK